MSYPPEPRVLPVSVPEGERLAEQLGLPAHTGSLLAFRMIANHPELARGIFTQHMALRHGGRLSERHRELLIMRVAWLAESSYEWAQHWAIAVAAGVPSDDVLRVRDWHGADCFSPSDRAVLQAVDDMFEHGTVLRTSWDRCSETLGGAMLALEVVAATVHWRGLAGLFRSLDVPPETGSAAWPPDGLSPATSGQRTGKS